MLELVMGATGARVFAGPRREQYLLQQCILFRVLVPGWALEAFKAWDIYRQVHLLFVALT